MRAALPAGDQRAFPVEHRSPVQPRPGEPCSSAPGPAKHPAPSSSLWLEGLTLSLQLQLSPNLLLANSRYSSVPPRVRAETSQLISHVLQERRVCSSSFPRADGLQMEDQKQHPTS